MRGAIRDARPYELMTIFSPDVAEDEIQTTIEAVVGYITGATGENVAFNRESPWGRRRLSYAIRHTSRDVRDGFYTLFHFEVAPHKVIDIEREIKLNDRIMRYLLTQYTPKLITEEPADGATEESTDATLPPASADAIDTAPASDASTDPAPEDPAPEEAAPPADSLEDKGTEEA